MLTFMSGEGNGYDFSDIATFVEFTGVYAGAHSQEFRDLYARVRPYLAPRAADVTNIVSEYTSGDCEKLEASS
jgi:hypothetical protein